MEEKQAEKVRTQQIKHIGGGVLFECEIPREVESGLALRWALEKATATRAYLSGAYLSGAYLSGAYLRGADLSSADLRGADLSSADLSSADLSGADLSSADLSSADLRGADLSSADLSSALIDGKKLVGDRPVLQIGPIGSRSDYFEAFITEAGVMVQAGCFYGTVAEFETRCAETHGDNEHAREYKAALALIQVHADIWTPKVEQTEPVAESA